MRPYATAVYKLTPNEFEQEIQQFCKNRYGYKPNLDLFYDTQSIHPVHLTFKEELGEDYRKFWLALWADLYAIGADDTYEADDLGHYVLQLLCGKRIKECTFYPFEAKYVEYAHGDDASLLIFTDETPLPNADKEVVKEKMEALEERLHYFSFTKEQLIELAPRNVQFERYGFDSQGQEARVLYFFEENPIEVHFIYDEKKVRPLALRCTSYVHSEIMMKKVEKLLEELKITFSKQFVLPEESIVIEKNLYPVPVKPKRFEEMNLTENMVLALSEANYSYKDIQRFLQKEERFVDNIMQRIKRKQLLARTK